ncbi:MAG: UDP-N-acetylmuramoyl-L-alanine--D-glutamate ligase [Hyphomicrobiaceae bacterium]
MIFAKTFRGQRVAVFGLGGSGLMVARALLEGGAKVAAWDDGETGRVSAEAEGIPVVDLATADWSEFRALVLAPGVALTHPEPHWTVDLATKAGVDIIGDMELFQRERASDQPTAPLVAITGTNGKSTTTALISHVLQALGVAVEMGGNIGKAVMSLEPAALDRVHVLEVSSYQIDLAPTFKPTVGVLLNISPDHIDRHGTLENYAAVKAKMIANSERSVVGIDDTLTKAVAEDFEPKDCLYAITTGKGAAIIPRLYAIDQTLFVRSDEANGRSSSREVANLEGVASLRGLHNVQNALAALAVLRALQDHKNALVESGNEDQQWTIPDVWCPDEFQAALETFPGLAHRMEEVGHSSNNRIFFINDSKATNAEATSKALSAFEKNIYWIAGGQAKDGGISQLEAYFPRIAKVYLIGDAAAEFAETLEGKVPYQRCGRLDVAVAAAASQAICASGVSAEKPAAVLFSPACASFDQFKNFEVRGDTFREYVSALPNVLLKEETAS